MITMGITQIKQTRTNRPIAMPTSFSHEHDHAQLQQEIIACRRCPRLVAWRERVAREKVKRHSDETYWGKAVPSFGSPDATLLVVGLAPAAHGANRTGRMFTGDRSGEWLYRALHKAGFANQPTYERADDGLMLQNAYITGMCHCAPPDNKPLPEEIANCRPFFRQELALLTQVRAIIALGKYAFDTVIQERAPGAKPKPKFGHGAEYLLPGDVLLIASFHPSQQNTFTGRLTEPMFDAVFSRARQYI